MAMVIKKEILPKIRPGIRVIYGDTDSVMVDYDGVEDVQEAGRISHYVADKVTEEFARRGWKQMILEFEKIYHPYLLEGKKRHMGLKYEPKGEEMVCKGVDAKGLETERKDTLPYLKKIMYDVREDLLPAGPGGGAATLRRLHAPPDGRGRGLPEDLVLQRALSHKVKDKTDTIPWAKVNALRKMREKGSEFAANEQVPYVITAGHKKANTTELAECAEYAKAHGVPLNYLWYFEHCIKEAMHKIFSIMIPKHSWRTSTLRGWRNLHLKAPGHLRPLHGRFASPTLRFLPLLEPVVYVPHVPRPHLAPERRSQKDQMKLPDHSASLRSDYLLSLTPGFLGQQGMDSECSN